MVRKVFLLPNFCTSYQPPTQDVCDGIPVIIDDDGAEPHPPFSSDGIFTSTTSTFQSFPNLLKPLRRLDVGLGIDSGPEYLPSFAW
jgi:hypothetical protein